MSKYSVKSIFGPTIQGEGSFSGTPVKFLRFAGCNKWNGLAVSKPSAMCHFCDTDFRDGSLMTAEQIVENLNKLGEIKVVVISGGEPTLQIDSFLLDKLKKNNYSIHLETNGSNSLDDMIDYFDHITMSPKQPRDETRLERCHDLKILWPPIDKKITPELFAGFQRENNYLQPLWEEGNKTNLNLTIEKLYELKEWKLSLQTHKIIGVD